MKGDVRLRVECLMPERLIQRAMDMGVRFSSVSRADAHTIIVETGARDADRLLKLCERYSIPATILARRGRSAASRALRSRWTLAAGIIACIALCWLFLGHIWRIDVTFTGDAAVHGSDAPFRQALSEMGIRPGIARGIDTQQLSNELLAESGGYSFVGVRVEGVRLLVEAAPEVPAPEIYDVEAARDLYADRGGIVESVNVESGTACVSVGDTIRRGQLLIRGEEKTSSEGTRGIGALGEVVIRTWYEGSAEGSLYEAQLRYTGRRSVSARLSTPWFDIPITQPETYAQQAVEYEIIPIGGLYIPVSIVRETIRETQSIREEGDKVLLSSRISALAMADARAALTEALPDAFEISRSWIRFSQPDSDTLRASAVYEITMNTAVTREDILGG